MKKFKAKLIFAICLIVVAGTLMAALIILGNNNKTPDNSGAGAGTSQEGGSVTLPPVDLGEMFQ